MGKRVPITIKLHQGTFRPGDVKITHGDGSITELPKPYILRATAKKYFVQIAEMVADMNLLKDCDTYALALLANDLDMYHQADKLIKKEGMTHVDKDGMTRLHPMVRTRKDAAASIFNLVKQFGLTPIARAGLDIELKQDYGQKRKVAMR